MKTCNTGTSIATDQSVRLSIRKEVEMNTREITRTEWPAFFDSFSRRHEGARITLEVFGPDIGDQINK